MPRSHARNHAFRLQLRITPAIERAAPPVNSREPILEMAAENLDLAATAVGIGRGVSDTNPQTVGSRKRAFHRARRNGFHCVEPFSEHRVRPRAGNFRP